MKEFVKKDDAHNRQLEELTRVANSLGVQIHKHPDYREQLPLRVLKAAFYDDAVEELSKNPYYPR